MKKVSKNIIIGLFFTFAIIFIVYQAMKESKEGELLESYHTNTAILVRIYQGTAKTPPSGDFIYKVDGKEYKFSQSGNYNEYMNIGDTVLIKYSTEDPSVARVIDKYYMQKYRHLKGK